MGLSNPGGGGLPTDGSDGLKLPAGRTLIAGSAGQAAAGYVVLMGGVDLVGFDGEVGLYPGAGSVRAGGDGLIIPSFTSIPATVEEGQIYEDKKDTDTSARRPRYYDSTAWWHLQTMSGWSPYLFPIGYTQDGVYTTALNLAASHGTLAVPFIVPAPMHLAGVSIWNTDTASARSWEVALWHQPHAMNSTDDKLLTKILGSQQFDSFTASAASLRTATYSAGVIVPAGLVWATIKNTHASNTLGIGSAAGSTQMPINTGQTKTLTSTSFDGTTLDFVAATWTKVTGVYAIALRGKVFGQSTAF